MFCSISLFQGNSGKGRSDKSISPSFSSLYSHFYYFRQRKLYTHFSKGNKNMKGNISYVGFFLKMLSKHRHKTSECCGFFPQKVPTPKVSYSYNRNIQRNVLLVLLIWNPIYVASLHPQKSHLSSLIQHGLLSIIFHLNSQFCDCEVQPYFAHLH